MIGLIKIKKVAGINYGFHDYKQLIGEWRRLSGRENLKFECLLKKDGLPVMKIRGGNHSPRDVIYLSAGIHGDEPAGPRALLEWAKVRIKDFTSIPLLIYPCLNPWGYLNNSRFDLSGKDLNRVWGCPSHPLVKKVTHSIDGTNFGLSLNLHEDYDANGIYLYEPCRGGKNDSSAELILQAGEKIIPRDTRLMIDGRKARDGIIRPRAVKDSETEMPEALYLFNQSGGRNFTIETPSEFDFQARVSAQVRMIDAAIKAVYF